MIIMALVNLYSSIIEGVLNLINLSSIFPQELENAFNYIFTLMNNCLVVVDFFLPLNMIKIALGIVLPIILFHEVYTLTMWVLKKIPILNIH